MLDQNADSRDTTIDVLSRLHEKFHIGEARNHLVVTGDAKTYQHLQSLKLDYGQGSTGCSWVIFIS